LLHDRQHRLQVSLSDAPISDKSRGGRGVQRVDRELGDSDSSAFLGGGRDNLPIRQSAMGRTSSPDLGTQEDSITVVFEKARLAVGEGPNIDAAVDWNTHALQRRLVGDR
jgi:hypothetical protein